VEFGRAARQICDRLAGRVNAGLLIRFGSLDRRCVRAIELWLG
jgi:hypothetical protein